MKRYALRRLLGLIPTMWAIVTVSFALIHLAPGDPFAAEKTINKQARAELMRMYGFDRPLGEQYLTYLGNVARGNLGPSKKYPMRTVNELIRDGFPATCIVGLTALLWALLAGVGAGIVGAVRQNSAWDFGTMALAMLGISVPSFVLGPLLMLVFALSVYWLPAGGWGTWKHVLLPGLTLGTIYAAYVARLTRAGLLDVIRQDFVRTALAKVLPERLVIWRHVLKAGLLPTVTFLGPMIAQLFTGSIVVETIFATPGLGPYLVDSAHNKDYFVACGMVIFYSAFLLLANAAVDVGYGLLDPRVRYE